MEMSLDGKVTIVTGSGNPAGIGAAYAAASRRRVPPSLLPTSRATARSSWRRSSPTRAHGGGRPRRHHRPGLRNGDGRGRRRGVRRRRHPRQQRRDDGGDLTGAARRVLPRGVEPRGGGQPHRRAAVRASRRSLDPRARRWADREPGLGRSVRAGQRLRRHKARARGTDRRAGQGARPGEHRGERHRPRLRRERSGHADRAARLAVSRSSQGDGRDTARSANRPTWSDPCSCWCRRPVHGSPARRSTSMAAG